MARLARVVVPRYPHHVTQRGNRRQRVFFCGDDYRAYIALMAEAKERAKVEVWAYCLMPNHVHLVVKPETENGLRQFFGEAHRHYTRRINFREGWRGYLWQGRFQSFVMDEKHLIAAVRYVEMNPVRAGLTRTASEWIWSSARAYLAGINDKLVSVAPMLDRINNWSEYLRHGDLSENLEAIRAHTATGRPLGDNVFLEAVETRLGRNLRKRRPGPKKKPSVIRCCVPGTHGDPEEFTEEEGISREEGEEAGGFRVHNFHTGKIMVSVYETEAGKVHINGSLYDEFIQILEGRLILTPDAGGRFEYKAGDTLVLPKGYVGHCEMPEKYHDLASLRQIHAMVEERFPDGLQVIIRDLTVEGERVAVEAETLGTRADGKVYNNRYHYLVIVRPATPAVLRLRCRPGRSPVGRQPGGGRRKLARRC